jgi:uncharacterized protein
VATQSSRKRRSSGAKASAVQRLFGGKSGPMRIAVAVFAALTVGATIGWWSASHVAPHPTQQVAARPQPQPQPQPTPEPITPPTPVVPEVAAPDPAPPPQIAALPPEAFPMKQLWRRNAIPFTPVAGKPMIAIVIDDMGLDVPRSARVISLPPPLTTSFLSYGHNLARQTAAAHAAGHELMLHMPMEPIGTGYDAGPDVLLTSMSDDAIRTRLRQSLSSFQGYVGINNHMGSRFTADARGMEVVMHELKTDGLLFLDSVTSGRTLGAKTAAADNVANLSRNVFLDDSPEPAAIQLQLRRVEDIARKTGSAIAIGHPRETTIAALTEWLQKARAEGFQFVPVSALAKAKYGKE